MRQARLPTIALLTLWILAALGFPGKAYSASRKTVDMEPLPIASGGKLSKASASSFLERYIEIAGTIPFAAGRIYYVEKHQKDEIAIRHAKMTHAMRIAEDQTGDWYRLLDGGFIEEEVKGRVIREGFTSFERHPVVLVAVPTRHLSAFVKDKWQVVMGPDRKQLGEGSETPPEIQLPAFTLGVFTGKQITVIGITDPVETSGGIVSIAEVDVVFGVNPAAEILIANGMPVKPNILNDHIDGDSCTLSGRAKFVRYGDGWRMLKGIEWYNEK